MTALENARALLSARCADLEKERLAHRRTRAELRRAKAKAARESSNVTAFCAAAGASLNEACDELPAVIERVRKTRMEHDGMSRDLDGARAEWRHHLERIADAIECEVSLKDDHAVLARKVAEAAKELHERSLILLHEVERERGIVDALVRKTKESEEA